MICTVKPGNTVKETQELQLMRENIWHDAENNTITVSYPVIGDIVLLKYSNELSKPAYRYGKVIKVIEDDNGPVRDAVVATRSRRRKEKPGQYAPGPMDHQLVAVQRLVLLLPKEQQDQLPAEEPGLHVCEETLQVPDHHEDLATAPPLPPVLQLLPLNVPQTRLWMRLSPWTPRSPPSTTSSPRPTVSKSTWRSSSTAWIVHCCSPISGNQISVTVIS